MDEKEILTILKKMEALEEGEFSLPSGKKVDKRYQMGTLMQDPILLNRLAVEVLQKIDCDKTKFGVVVTPDDDGVFFGFSVAMAAWTRFGLCSDESGEWKLPKEFVLSDHDKVVVAVLTTDDAEKVNALVKLVESRLAKPVAIVALYANEDTDFDLPTFTLVD